MSKYDITVGGVPTRGETYAKLLHHLREAQDLAAMMSHLHNTEGNDFDKALARGWLGIEELIKRFCHNVTELAKGNLQ